MSALMGISELIDRYDLALLHHDPLRHHANASRLGELRLRIDELDVLLDVVLALQSEPEGRLDVRGVKVPLNLAVRALTELFYFSAGRVLTLLRHPTSGLRELASIDVPAVANIRNYLVQHPDEKGLLSMNWSFDEPWGPRLKPFMPTDRGVRADEGLFVNADRFANELRRLLEAAHETVGPTTH